MDALNQPIEDRYQKRDGLDKPGPRAVGFPVELCANIIFFQNKINKLHMGHFHARLRYIFRRSVCNAKYAEIYEKP